MKKWRCSVCGYIHYGEEPPVACPVCGAPASKFAEISAGDPSASAPHAVPNETDVIVVGSGAAALAAAVTARQLGLGVVVLEKASSIGGTTARSGGGFWIPNNRHQRAAAIVDSRKDAMRYMARYSYPHLYNPRSLTLGLPTREYRLIEAYCDHASEMLDFLEDAGALSSIMEINWRGLAQVDYMDHLPENKGIRGRTLYPTDEHGAQAMGAQLVASLDNWLKAHGVTIYTDHAVTEIIRHADGAIDGVQVRAGDETRTVFARRGVIFGSGGFSHNAELMLRLGRGPHYGGCAVPTNTGDFLTMAASIGAAIGNTAGAFRAESMIDVHLRDPDGSSNVFYIPGDSVLEVNKYGRRVVDEKRNYCDRAMTHFVWDPVAAEWTNMLLFLIYDERTSSLWQGYPPYPVKSQPLPDHILTGQTLASLTRAIEARLEQLAPHTGAFSLAPEFLDNLKDTVARFGDHADAGKDADFARGEYAYDREWTTFPPTVPGVSWPDPRRTNYTMHPLASEGPYYAIILAAGTLDTNGGPLTDERARVLDWSQKPIPGLYGAGNCIASPTANAYWGAGSTIGPAMTFGYLAARDLAARQ